MLLLDKKNKDERILRLQLFEEKVKRERENDPLFLAHEWSFEETLDEESDEMFDFY